MRGLIVIWSIGHLSEHCSQDLIVLFNQTFLKSYNTLLVKGDSEPVYLPSDSTRKNSHVVFAHGYFASALHEIAHWCIAGRERRLLEDYGYWYCADGRDAEQQAQFEKVEIKPQAIEWAFSVAAGKRFQVSTDNLSGVEPDRAAFEKNVHSQVLQYLAEGFPPRAAQFIQVLRKFYNTSPLSTADFNVFRQEVKAVA